jgi:hypothetical protein
MGFDK